MQMIFGTLANFTVRLCQMVNQCRRSINGLLCEIIQNSAYSWNRASRKKNRQSDHELTIQNRDLDCTVKTAL